MSPFHLPGSCGSYANSLSPDLHKEAIAADMDYITLYSLSLLFYTVLTSVEQQRLIQHSQALLIFAPAVGLSITNAREVHVTVDTLTS